MSKPVAYKRAADAMDVAIAGGGFLIQVSGDLCEDGAEGFMVVTKDHKLHDERGVAYYARHQCLRMAKGEKPGKWELTLEEVEDAE